LTLTSSSPTLWESTSGYIFDSIAFAPGGNFAYLGQISGGNVGAPTVVCSVDFSTGTLAPIGSVQPATTGVANQVAISPNGGFLYSINNTFSQADAFTIGSSGASLTEISGSPYSVPFGPSSLAVHPAGNFLYLANSNSTFQAPPSTGPVNGSIYGFSIDSGTGALTPVAGSPYSAGVTPGSIVADPGGNFAYVTTTTTGTPFAQISGYAINIVSGVLAPLSWTPWTDSTTSNGAQLAISNGPSTTLNPSPMISSLSPPSSVATDTPFTLQINGANFMPGSKVYFGGQLRNPSFVSSTQLNANILATDIDNDGNAVVFVFNPLPGGGASTSVEFPVSALSPVISSISPSSVSAASIPFTLSAVGSNFVASSVISYNGIPQPTQYGGPTLLRIPITSDMIGTPGTATVSVTTPSNGVPGGGNSDTFLLTILPPQTQPMVTSISPTSATEGGLPFTLIVNGSGFVAGSQVSFNMNNVTTTLVSSTLLTAVIPASAIAVAGYMNVVVTNPGNLASLPLTFTVTNPLPGGVFVSAGNNALTLSVIGTGFVPTSVVFVNGSSRVTTYESSSLLQATLLPGDLSQGGTLNITVVNLPPGGGTTSPISVPVNPVPKESLLLPSSATLGSADIELQVTGSNFNSSSTILVNGAALLTKPVSATLLKATLPASDMAQVATLIVAVKNPAPGGGTTSGLPLAVVAPNGEPVVGALSPASATVCGPAFTLTISGSNFTASSVVSFGGNAEYTAILSATEVQANIPASSIAVAGTPIVVVTNPGVVPSTAVSFTVNNLAPLESQLSPSSATLGRAALPLQVTGNNFNPCSTIFITSPFVKGTALPTTYVSATLLQATLPASDMAQVGTLNVSVENPSPGGGTSIPIQFSVADYALTGPPSPAKVNAGGSAVFILTVAPLGGGYPYPITFTATGLPPDGSASFLPSTPVTPDASTQTVTLSISTMPHSATSTINFPRRSHPELPVPLLAGMAFGLGGFWLFTLRGRAKRLVPQLLLALLISAVVGLTACGAVGGGTPPSPQVNPATGTPAGTYSIEVKATSGGLSHSTTVTLTVV
jgi:Lactonase, 7-bladed beta-propeller